jgi:hypothetical protein
VNGESGTTGNIGTVSRPSNNIADSKTIASNNNLKIFTVLPGSSFTLASAFDGYEFTGFDYDVALGGQSVNGTLFRNANITGNDDGSNTIATIYQNCVMATSTLGLHVLSQCGLSGTITLAEAGTYDWTFCYSRVAGTGTPSVDFGTLVANSNLNIRAYSGGIEIQNMGDTGTDNMSLEGNGQLQINANCSGGTVAIRGHFTVTDNAGGAVTLSDDARIDITQINDQVSDVLKTDTISERTQGIPPATPTFEEAIDYIYMALRNKLIVDGSGGTKYKQFTNNAGTVIWKKEFDEASSVYTEEEGVSGP